MKKVFTLATAMLCLFTLTACKPAVQEFSGSGITISLTEEFIEKEVIQAPFYLESTRHIFMGMRESKTDLTGINIHTLTEYIEAVMENGGVTAEVSTYDEGDVLFMYAYYTKTVSEVQYGYMLLVMEGANYFYTMNFGCLQKNLEASKSQYLEWAATIVIE